MMLAVIYYLFVHEQTGGANTRFALAVASAWVAKRWGGNEKHHSVVFEPHPDRAAARTTKTPRAKSVVELW